MTKVEKFFNDKNIPKSHHEGFKVSDNNGKLHSITELIEEFAEKQRSDDVDFIVDDWHSMKIYTNNTKKRKLKVRLKHLTRK